MRLLTYFQPHTEYLWCLKSKLVILQLIQQFKEGWELKKKYFYICSESKNDPLKITRTYVARNNQLNLTIQYWECDVCSLEKRKLTKSTRSRASCLQASLDCSLRSISACFVVSFLVFSGQWHSLKRMETNIRMFIWMSSSGNRFSGSTGRFPSPMIPAWNTVEVPSGCVGIDPNFKFSSKRHFVLAELDVPCSEYFPPKILANGVEMAPSTRRRRTMVRPDGLSAMRDKIEVHWKIY